MDGDRESARFEEAAMMGLELSFMEEINRLMKKNEIYESGSNGLREELKALREILRASLSEIRETEIQLATLRVASGNDDLDLFNEILKLATEIKMKEELDQAQAACGEDLTQLDTNNHRLVTLCQNLTVSVNNPGSAYSNSSQSVAIPIGQQSTSNEGFYSYEKLFINCAEIPKKSYPIGQGWAPVFEWWAANHQGLIRSCYGSAPCESSSSIYDGPQSIRFGSAPTSQQWAVLDDKSSSEQEEDDEDSTPILRNADGMSDDDCSF